MKKILFIVFAIAGFSNLASAQQEKPSAAMTPAPTKAESENATAAKKAAAGMKATPSTPAKDARTPGNTTAGYKKAGLSDVQIADINKATANLDRKKVVIQNDNTLSPDQKKNGIAAIEAERNVILMNSMGKTKYQTYSTQQAQKSVVKAKEVKTAKP